MSKTSLQSMTISELVDGYAAIGVAQYEADLFDKRATFNALVDDLIAFEAELKGRASDERRALVQLYSHPNIQVRLNAAHATLAVAPREARTQLEAIRASRWHPQAMHAGMSLRNLDSGVYRPK